jgi:hypothetical protein
MKTIFLALFLALSLAACGTQDKAENPFGKAGNPQKGNGKTEKEFKDTCAKQHGSLILNGTTCKYTSHVLHLDQAQIDKDFDNGNIGFKVYSLGTSVSQGAKVWADKDGGLPLHFYLNGGQVNEMPGDVLPEFPVNAGRLEVYVNYAHYNYLNVSVAECFTKASPVPCP